MKVLVKILVAIGLIAGVSVLGFSADKKKDVKKSDASSERSSSATYFSPGNFAVGIGIGFGWYFAFNLSFYPQAEFILTEVKIADTIPIQIGIAARGYYSSYSYNVYAN